ncbi:hypothetical protein VKT23_010613 [Stygiomarasmius scandens]|uniref:Uncharacterized protein n=1 Tax=Marasmiellus scandens TaxID=2682957 RepID=A0ABR1JE50_9AGAR
MRFSTISAILCTVASALVVSARGPEAVRFGVLNTSPIQVNAGDVISIKYNSTLAFWQPKYVDFYIQGHRNGSNVPTPYILIQRNDYASDQTLLCSNYTVPDLVADYNAEDWTLWAYVTYPSDSGPLEVGGVASGFTFETA